MFVFVIFLHYLVYEIVYFFYPVTYPVLGYVSALWKVVVPFGLALLLGLPNVALLKTHQGVAHYLLFFGLFLLWALVPSVWSAAGIVEWLKLIPRFAFFFAVALMFIRAPRIAVATVKLIVGWALLSVAQYLVLTLTGAAESPGVYDWGGASAGPLGLLGNVTSVMHFPGIEWPIARLHGFWNEPSNASASLFASYFLARWLHALTLKRRWRRAAWVCLFGGFACLSNAGFLAFAVASLMGVVARLRYRAGMVRRAMLSGAAVALIIGALWGRLYVAESWPDNSVLRAIVGLREQPEDVRAGGLNQAFGGRLALLAESWETVKSHPLGLGMAASGEGQALPLNASAPVMWFTFVGPFGLILILLRDLPVVKIILSDGRRSRLVLLAGQAFVVVMVQQVSYGSWMNPLCFITAATVFATASWVRRGLVDAPHRRPEGRAA